MRGWLFGTINRLSPKNSTDLLLPGYKKKQFLMQQKKKRKDF